MTTRWELVITRLRQDVRDGRVRTVGHYQVYHDKVAVAWLKGYTAEPGGPGDNNHIGNDRRIEAGTYQLGTHDGTRYRTIDYGIVQPRPAIEILNTGVRRAILFHPGERFLSSIGCINPSGNIGTSDMDIVYGDSRSRVIWTINDMASYIGRDFPHSNGKVIPNATICINGEPC